MIKYDNKYSTVDSVLEITKKRKPDFNNLLKVLNRQKPSRPTLFEFFLNGEIYTELSGYEPENSFVSHCQWIMEAYRNAGYDYFTLPWPHALSFQTKQHKSDKSISLNDTAMIFDRYSFDEYKWPDIEKVDFSYLEKLKSTLIPGMKAVPYSPRGVLENTTQLLGYDNMCYLLCDDPKLLGDVFNKTGEILLSYYDRVIDNEIVCAAIVNDDWGFNTQTMLSKSNMLQYVIPWHKRIVERIHKSGKPAILHSCGQLETVMEEIIGDIGFDAKHSYEDNIISVEDAYDLWGSRIAILGGLDVDFLCTASSKEVFNRASCILEKTKDKGGYALGTGNSVPTYVPKENYYAMIMAALV